MKVSKIIICSLILFSSVGAYAQKSNYNNAVNALNVNEIEKAVKYIEMAATNPKTANFVKMHDYRGKIYYEIYSNADYKAMDPMAIIKCAESWITLYKHPKVKKWYNEDDLTRNIQKAAVGLYSSGQKFYDSKDYSNSKKMFNKIFDLITIDEKNSLQRNNITKELTWLNLYFVSYAEGDNQKSKEFLQKLIDINYQEPKIYSYMANILLEENDSEGALEIIKYGRGFFESDVDLIIAELNYYLGQSDFINAEKLLKLAVEEDPNNHLLFFALGSSYDELNDFEKAENAYLEAIDIKPDFYDALYNLGVMYYNKGANMLKEANNIKDWKKADAYTKKAEAKMLKGLPYIEKCHEIDSEDKNILLVLKELYYRNGDDEKYKNIITQLK